MTGLARTLEPMHDPACPPVRLAEAAGVLSLATDLAMGQPLEHGLRTAIMALRTAQAMGLPGDDQVTVFYTGVLHFAGCTAESEIDARFFGDELAARPRMMTVAHGSRLELIATAMRVAHQDSAPLARAAMMARAAFGGVAEFRRWAASHCDVARLLGARLGLPAQAQQALRHLYERWDGNGMPGELRGTQIPQAVRLMQVAQDADVAWQHGGSALVRRTLAERAGSGLDPQAVGAFLSAGDRLVRGPGHALHLGRRDGRRAGSAAPAGRVAARCRPLGDRGFRGPEDDVDGRSFPRRRRPRRRAGAVAGLAAPEVLTLRRAGLVHDIGRVAVPVSVWAKPGPLTRGEHEQVRLHGYHSERVLEACPGLHPLARLAGSHGERSDGSGYHRGSRAGDLPAAAWLLAAADCYQAMREPRAHRPARSAQAAADELCRDAEAGKLPAEAVRAVLTAAGQPPRPVPRPAGLSERECEVLSLIARGMATKQAARQLGISPKTCDHHIQHLYRKTGLSTRAGATLFALEHGLIPPD